jgi:hypothetical protein
MEMGISYDLRIQQPFDLTGPVNDLLDEVEDPGEGVAPTPAPRVREVLTLPIGCRSFSRKSRATSKGIAPPGRGAVPSH